MDANAANQLNPGDKVKVIANDMYVGLLPLGQVFEVYRIEDKGSSDPRIVLKGATMSTKIFFPRRFEKVVEEPIFVPGDRVEYTSTSTEFSVRPGDAGTVGPKGIYPSAVLNGKMLLDIIWDRPFVFSKSQGQMDGGYPLVDFKKIDKKRQRTARQVVEEVFDNYPGVSDVVIEEILTALNKEFNLS